MMHITFILVFAAMGALGKRSECTERADYSRCSDLRSSKHVQLFKSHIGWTRADTLMCKVALYIDLTDSHGETSRMHYYKEFEKIFLLVRHLYRAGNENIIIMIRAAVFGATWASQGAFLDKSNKFQAQFDDDPHFDALIRNVRENIDMWLEVHDELDVSVEFYNGIRWNKEGEVEIKAKP